ncbi:MAG: hypothetical protein J0M24_23905 [Verrucomicrobia bacterium]|nr:hypothetical protein [Verrucomicrobiota bacterium]
MSRNCKPAITTRLYKKHGRWADAPLATLMHQTGTELEHAVCDLLANLMHWCDFHEEDFDRQLARARDHYKCEKFEEETLLDWEKTRTPRVVT